jgi:spermidine synthase
MLFIKKIIGKLFLADEALNKFEDMQVEVSEQDGIISMHIGSVTIQSSMQIDKPFHLVLDYGCIILGQP